MLESLPGGKNHVHGMLLLARGGLERTVCAVSQERLQ